MSKPAEAPLRLFYVPVPDRETGKALVTQVLGARLAACGNLLGPMLSFYEWEGEQKQEEEFLLILKTPAEKAYELQGVLEKIHPYECPCISSFPVEANADFVDWVGKQV
ncbi:divalent-cation tolerance protein CutA [Kiritimatiellaeota bacterium B1221]|nr:divalent-cation tolerance protein CutA [Kiritimatiellaeota bacterium B1221]